jgi:hypothetical protein
LQRLAEDACLDTPGSDRLEVFACLQMTVAASPLPEAYRACSLGLPSDDGVVSSSAFHHEKGSEATIGSLWPRRYHLTIAGGIPLT